MEYRFRISRWWSIEYPLYRADGVDRRSKSEESLRECTHIPCQLNLSQLRPGWYLLLIVFIFLNSGDIPFCGRPPSQSVASRDHQRIIQYVA